MIVIIGIVAAFAAPRFFDDRTFLQRGYYEELVAALKYSQKLAVASGCPVRVVIDAAGYAARQQAAQGGHLQSRPTRLGRRTSRWPTAMCSPAARRSGVTVSPAVTRDVRRARQHRSRRGSEHQRRTVRVDGSRRQRVHPGTLTMRGRGERGATLIELVDIDRRHRDRGKRRARRAVEHAWGAAPTPWCMSQAVAIAEAYLEEISLKSFADPDGVDGEAARPDFDDVDDYHGLVDNGARDQFGTALAPLAQYTVTVTVTPSAALAGVPARTPSASTCA